MQAVLREPIHGKGHLFHSVAVRKRNHITPLNITPVNRGDNCGAKNREQ